MSKRRGLLGLLILLWLGFCAYLVWRGVTQTGWLAYLDSGNVSSILTASAVVSAVAWWRTWLIDQRAHTRHLSARAHAESLHDEHMRHLHHLRDHLDIPPLGGGS